MTLIRMLGRVVRATCALSVVIDFARADNDVTTSAEKDVPNWASANALQLKLSTTPGEWLPLQYIVIPLTAGLGLNATGTSRGIVGIDGNLIPADASNYNQITNPDEVAYLSCDESSSDGLISKNQMLNTLMAAKPKAIVLYSTSQNWCSLSNDGDLPYSSILSMVDPGEAADILDAFNETTKGHNVRVSIMGNATNDSSDSDQSNSHGSPAVAMSVLYSITGIITVLFLVIIATGAVRAHRYPERYGPRRGTGGRPRQSRAKGLARAVLDTIPVVKFGNQEPTKPDPELELETATMDGQEPAPQHARGALDSKTDRADEAVSPSAANSSTAQASGQAVVVESESAPAEGAGCSICTDDFKVGEDVRVLPCNHQFHPQCVDPWLINVSGTCPLCRYDLRPDAGNNPAESPNTGESELPPPLALEADDGSGPPRQRSSRFLDIHRLRHAPFEERIQTLREMGTQRIEPETEAESGAPEGDGEQRHQGASLAAKLKEKFRIKTRAQPSQPPGC